MNDGKIHGVKFKPLAVFADDRGILMEVLRDDEALLERFGQTTYTMSYPGTIKAFHWHRKQDDLWFVATGMAQVVLHDLREDSPTKGRTEVYCMGEHRYGLLLIPRGVAHGYRVLGEKPVGLIYHTTRSYNPKEPDEERIAHDDPAIGFDWTTQPR